MDDKKGILLANSVESDLDTLVEILKDDCDLTVDTVLARK